MGRILRYADTVTTNNPHPPNNRIIVQFVVPVVIAAIIAIRTQKPKKRATAPLCAFRGLL